MDVKQYDSVRKDDALTTSLLPRGALRHQAQTMYRSEFFVIYVALQHQTIWPSQMENIFEDACPKCIEKSSLKSKIIYS